jgi:hypothetical protein
MPRSPTCASGTGGRMRPDPQQNCCAVLLGAPGVRPCRAAGGSRLGPVGWRCCLTGGVPPEAQLQAVLRRSRRHGPPGPDSLHRLRRPCAPALRAPLPRPPEAGLGRRCRPDHPSTSSGPSRASAVLPGARGAAPVLASQHHPPSPMCPRHSPPPGALPRLRLGRRSPAQQAPAPITGPPAKLRRSFVGDWRCIAGERRGLRGW